jgi:hypothetical protein
MMSMSETQVLSRFQSTAGLWPAHVAANDLAAFRASASKAFLETRDTSFGRLREIIEGQVDHIAHLLLTSSPVHGLANATSDIDTICVVDGPDHFPERTATQIFDQSNHYETIVFTRAEVANELNRLAAVVAAPPEAQVRAFKTWDKGGPLTRKYLERLVNGVDTDGSLPYFDRLPALAELWCAASLARALVAIECAALAERSKQLRAALGYVVNGLLYAMDALMSRHGQVFSNKKWFLLRFGRFVESGAVEPGMADVATALDELWKIVFGALQRSTPAAGIAGEARALLARMERAFAIELSPQAVWVRDESAIQVPYLPGADAVLHDRMISLIPSLGNSANIRFGSSALAEPVVAGGLLNAARTGLLTPRFDTEGAGR